MSESTAWLTPQAYRKLRDELSELETDGRRRMEERLAEARSQGDIRENADYEAAKDEQGLMEARIRHLRDVLERAEVGRVEDSGSVGVGSLVRVVDDGGEETEYLVAATENQVPGYQLASPEGPLGRALLGAKPGDDVTYQAPRGDFTLRVLEVRPFPG
ncbi:MAG: transcription elongation factor GreA [Actinomycetota bacterium]|nr:transcription elongation factor GreA [Actinomycetota bacterium]